MKVVALFYVPEPDDEHLKCIRSQIFCIKIPSVKLRLLFSNFPVAVNNEQIHA